MLQKTIALILYIDFCVLYRWLHESLDWHLVCEKVMVQYWLDLTFIGRRLVANDDDWILDRQSSHLVDHQVACISGYPTTNIKSQPYFAWEGQLLGKH